MDVDLDQLPTLWKRRVHKDARQYQHKEGMLFEHAEARALNETVVLMQQTGRFCPQCGYWTPQRDDNPPVVSGTDAAHASN